MKKILLFAGVISILIFTLTACGADGQHKQISREIGIDVSSGNDISSYDTHSGNGDGTSCITLSFSDDKVVQQIENNSEWKKFPLDETVQILVYGLSDETMNKGPYLQTQDGKLLVPKIQNGYYLLIDRHSDANKEDNIFKRYSFNFTVALYDTDNDTLYFCKLDT